MEAYTTRTQVLDEGTVHLKGVPFDEGDAVEITVVRVPSSASSESERYPLRGTAYGFDDPFSLVSPSSEWDALQ